ncbi:unnamed protein product [Owenia fusiformis]|uniref:Uncharacterized protein n=1 Tax=Owenia fusiformis TaxID=6347 RepID=A0A8S4NCY6_OWEFU|nr:unnamed protein product [Owenia fusiformis]
MNLKKVKIVALGILLSFILYLYVYLSSYITQTDKKIKELEEQNEKKLDKNKHRGILQEWMKKNLSHHDQMKGIFYLKVNKAASNTLQIMFNKYADKHNQIVGMPCSNNGDERHLVGWPEPFEPEHLIPLRKDLFRYWEHLNEHVKYSSKIKQVMAPGSVFVASIREPFSHFYSYFNFYSMENTYRKYLKPPNKFKYFLDNVKTMPHLELIHHMPPSNPIAECFGIRRALQYNITVIEEKINEIEKEFDIVMVVEYLEESLILLTELSDLTIEDVVILKSNNVRNLNKSKPILTPNEYENLIQWNLADSMIYNHFNKTLWEKINKFGRHNMASKMEELNEAKSLQKNNNEEDLGKRKHEQKMQNIYYADNYFRRKMTLNGVYDLKKANRTCRYPPGRYGQ